MEILNIRGIHIAGDILRNAGELIVFIHGVGADRTAWKYQLPYFYEKGYSVAALDMRGSGDSDARDSNKNLLPNTLEEFAKDVDAVIKELGYRKAHWVGNSMGGVITLEAIRDGHRSLDKIVLSNTFAKHPDREQILPRAAMSLESKSMPEFANERIPLVLRRDIDSKTLDEAIYAMARKDKDAYLASWQATWSPDFTDLLPNITNRTLVVSGSLDGITAVNLSKEIAAGIPGAKHVHIEGAGHISNLDKPDEFNAALLNFLQQS